MIWVREEQMKPIRQIQPEKPKPIRKPMSDKEMWEFAENHNKRVKK